MNAAKLGKPLKASTRKMTSNNKLLISLFIRVLMRCGQANMSHHRFIILIQMLMLQPLSALNQGEKRLF